MVTLLPTINNNFYPGPHYLVSLPSIVVHGSRFASANQNPLPLNQQAANFDFYRADLQCKRCSWNHVQSYLWLIRANYETTCGLIFLFGFGMHSNGHKRCASSTPLSGASWCQLTVNNRCVEPVCDRMVKRRPINSPVSWSF